MTAPATHADESAAVILQRAEALVQLAKGFGYVLTIQTQPREPLQMGNYDVVVDVRKDHATYRGAA